MVPKHAMDSFWREPDQVVNMPMFPAVKASLRDYSGLGNHGTLIGAVWQDGIYGWGLRFNGAERVNIGNIGVTGDWTVDFWVNLSTPLPFTQYPVGLATTNAGIYMAFAGSSPPPGRWGLFDGGASLEGSPVVADAWYHVGIRKSGLNYFLYLNNTLDNSGVMADIDIDALILGARPDLAWPHSGVITLFRVYNVDKGVNYIDRSFNSARAIFGV